MSPTFDLIGHPEHTQPAYGFYAVFLTGVLMLSVIATLALKDRWRGRHYLVVFNAIWSAGVTLAIASDVRNTNQIRQMVENGHYQTVEGCLTDFHPGSEHGTKTTVGDERWAVGDYDFSYGAGNGRPGYHQTEPAGGIVHRDSYVKVSFLQTRGRPQYEIVRLETRSGLCPAAPDKAAQ